LNRRITRLLRLLKLLVRDARIPRPIRGLFLVGLLPLPGPFDEAILISALALLLFVRPNLIRTLWREAAANDLQSSSANQTTTSA
jgi:hypothetical protein